MESTNSASESILDSRDELGTYSSGNVEKPLRSCETCGHTTNINSGMKLHMKRKHDIDQMDVNTSIGESKELSESQNKCECIEAETGYSKPTGKLAWYR